MNRVELMGRLTKEPDVRYTQAEQPMAVARYTLAVDRRKKDQEADFIQCVAFGKAGEFAEKYLHKGMKIAVSGRIQTGSYKKNDQTIYTTEVVIEDQEFCERKTEAAPAAVPGAPEGFVEANDVPGWGAIPDDQEELPFT